MSMQDRNSTIKDNYYSSQLHACVYICLYQEVEFKAVEHWLL